MKVSLWIVLLSLLALVHGRDYCYGGKMCSKNFECEQNDGYGGINGWCCNGKCTNTQKILPRGAFCNNSDPCVGECGSAEFCLNNVCTGYGVTETCACVTSTSCFPPPMGNLQATCALDTMKCTLPLPRDAACSVNTSCASNACYQGTCLGSNLKLGSSCRISQECGNYQCANGKCAYKTVGMPCTASSQCDSTKNFCNTTSSQCQQLLTAGMNCTSSAQCVTTTYCPYILGVGYTNCTMKQSEGQDCSSSMPCGANLYCLNYNFGVQKCVRYNSIASYAYCGSSSSVCMSNNVCTRYGANTTASFCVPYYSQPAGANCSTDSICPEYGQCNYTTSPPTCTESFMGKACDSNSTNSDNTYCGKNLECGCNNKCYEPDYTYTSCPSGASLAAGDPTKMNAEDTLSTAKYYCCNYCSYASTVTTGLTGFDVNCLSYKFSLKPVCNLTSGGSMALIGCGGCFTATTNLSLIVALLASLVAYFY